MWRVVPIGFQMLLFIFFFFQSVDSRLIGHGYINTAKQMLNEIHVIQQFFNYFFLQI